MSSVIKYLPLRLTANAVLDVLEKLGIDVPLSISVSAKDSRESLSYAVRASKWSVDVKDLDAALAKTDLGIAERLRYKFALENCGLI
jgi:hypothetical protein